MDSILILFFNVLIYNVYNKFVLIYMCITMCFILLKVVQIKK